MSSILDKVLGWARLRLTEEDIQASSESLEEAKRIEQLAETLHHESSVMGARQRQLRGENHLGRDLQRIFRNA